MPNSETDTTRRTTDLRRWVTYILYGAALFTSSVVTFGTAGILPGLVIPVAWCYVFSNRSRPAALVHVIVVALLGFCLLGLLTPAVQTAREASRRTQCRNNLHLIGLALHNYHDVYGSFPPAWTTAADGRPLHSWRVLILPYLDQAPLYEMFDLSEPWDSPQNLELAGHLPDVYACPSRAGHHDVREYTSYVAVVGGGTPWPGSGTRSFTDFRDGTSNTILVVEYDSGILWTEPRDLEIDEALQVLPAPDPDWIHGHRTEDFFEEHYNGLCVLLGDGSVRFESFGGDRELWSSLLTINDGAPREEWDAAFPYSAGESRLRVGNCVRLALFVFLVLLPLPWVWLNPYSEIDQSQQSREP